MLSRCTNNVTISDMTCDRIEIDFHILDKVMIQNVTCNYLFAESREAVSKETLFIDNSKLNTFYIGSNANISVLNTTINRFSGTVPYGSDKNIKLFHCYITNAVEDYSRASEASDLFVNFYVNTFTCVDTYFGIRATRAIAFVSANKVCFTNCTFEVLSSNVIPAISGFYLINLNHNVKSVEFSYCKFLLRKMGFSAAAILVDCSDSALFSRNYFSSEDSDSYFVSIGSNYSGSDVMWTYNDTKEKLRAILNASSATVFKKYNITISTDTDPAESRGNYLPAESNPDLYNGFPYYKTDIKKQLWFDGSRFSEYDSAVAGVSRSGVFANKPASSDIYVGFRYFCTDKQTTEGATNGIEIIHKGSDVWVDALGRTVS